MFGRLLAFGNFTPHLHSSNMSTKPPNEEEADKINAQLRGTFTAEEVALLECWLPQYLSIKRVPGKKFVDLWGRLLQDFFANHLLPDLTPKEIASGVDEGKRKGERQQTVQKVCERISFATLLCLTCLSADQTVVQ